MFIPLKSITNITLAKIMYNVAIITLVGSTPMFRAEIKLRGRESTIKNKAIIPAIIPAIVYLFIYLTSMAMILTESHSKLYAINPAMNAVAPNIRAKIAIPNLFIYPTPLFNINFIMIKLNCYPP